MFMDSLKIVEEHLACLFHIPTPPGVVKIHFSLKVVPVRDIFVSVERASEDEGTVMEFANLPGVVAEVQEPDDHHPFFSTLGYSNRAWRRAEGGYHIENVTFFVISELWNKKSETPCFLLHQAQIEYESESITAQVPSSSSLGVRIPVLRTTQVGSAVTMPKTTHSEYSRNHWVSQSGKIFVNGSRPFAISIQNFLSGSDRALRMTVYGQLMLPDKCIAMDPQSGAICWWERHDSDTYSSTIKIMYFD